jgi:GNAT superfamily N-acetyltransferase
MPSSSAEFDGPRLAHRDEWLGCARLEQRCFGGPQPDPADKPPASARSPRHGGTYVIAHGGEPVSQISIFHHRLRVYDGQIRIGSIGGVCTDPEYRGLGLAGQLMQHCTRQLAEEGARLMVISGARGLYTRLGNALSGHYLSFSLEPTQAHPSPSDLRLRPATRADAIRCSALYQAEPVHFVRKLARYNELALQHDNYIHAEWWVIEHAENVEAYLMTGIPWEDMGQPEAGIRHVSEYAGSRLTLAEAASMLLAQGSIKHISWPVAWQDADLIHLLQARGFTATPITLPEHTMRIINFPALMADLRPILQARLSPALQRGLRFEQSGPLLGGSGDDRFTIRRGTDHLTLDGAAMTRLVMGDDQTLAVDAPGALADVVAALFPLPSFLPGLNYQ